MSNGVLRLLLEKKKSICNEQCFINICFYYTTVSIKNSFFIFTTSLQLLCILAVRVVPDTLLMFAENSRLQQKCAIQSLYTGLCQIASPKQQWRKKTSVPMSWNGSVMQVRTLAILAVTQHKSRQNCKYIENPPHRHVTSKHSSAMAQF